MNTVKDKIHEASYNMAQIAHLREVLPLRKEDWLDEEDMFEHLKEHTLINLAPIMDTLVIQEIHLKEEKSQGGIIIPASGEKKVQQFGMVMCIAPDVKKKYEESETPINLGDIIIYNRAFLVYEISYHGFPMDIIQPNAVLSKVPKSLLFKMAIREDPAAILNPRYIDFSDPEEAAKARNDSMPSGMVEGDQEKQKIDPHAISKDQETEQSKKGKQVFMGSTKPKAKK